MSDKWIPVAEFGKLIDEAEAAYQCEDWLVIGRINERLADVNVTLFWQNGESYTVVKPTSPLPFAEAPTLEERMIVEWRRQHEIFIIARNNQIESVMAACLGSMNTIARCLGYAPESED